MRRDNMIGIAAVSVDAEAIRLDAKVLVAPLAHGALATTDPGINEIGLADRDPFGLRSDRDDTAGCLMAHGQRQVDAAVLERQTLAVAEIVAAFPDMKIAVANARGDHFEQHLGALRRRRGRLSLDERLAESGDLVAFHAAPLPWRRASRAGGNAGTETSGAAGAGSRFRGHAGALCRQLASCSSGGGASGAASGDGLSSLASSDGASSPRALRARALRTSGSSSTRLRPATMRSRSRRGRAGPSG